MNGQYANEFINIKQNQPQVAAGPQCGIESTVSHVVVQRIAPPEHERSVGDNDGELLVTVL